jgi:3D (Asp-Asp-Asp) domain-containing protein
MYRYIMEMNDMETSDVYEGMELDISIDKDQLQEKIEFYTEQEAEAKRKIEEEKKRAEEEAARKAAEEAAQKEAQAKSNMTYVGKFKITGYDAWCYHCNGSTSGLTASGNVAVVGRTVAASSKYFALGTKIYIEGYGEYVVEDRGAFKSNVIDVATDSHSACYNLTGSANVYIIN